MYITLDSSDSKVLISKSARSITADAIDLSDSSQNYYFYIWGKSTKGTVSPKKVNFESTSSTTGTVELDFPITTYTFTLAVTETEPSELTTTEILSNAIFISYTQADLTYSTNVKFNLSTNGLTSPGKAYLNFYLDSDTWTDEQVSRLLSNFKIKVGFFKENGSAQTSEWGLESLSKTVPVSTSNWFASVASGSYDMKVTFSEQGGEYLVYEYSDKIIILPNRTINADIYLPNVLLNLPVAPSEFKAAYCMDYRFYSVYDSTTDTVTKLTSNNQIDDYDFNTYGILFSWTDNSNNESGFKITLADLSKITDGTLLPSQIIASVPSVMTDSFWNQYVTPFIGQDDVVKVFTPDNYNSMLDYYAGSVKKNETSLIVLGNFGSCYIAKIEAINPAGLSDACYVTLNEDFNVGVYDTNYTNNTAVYTGTAFSSDSKPCNVINRYKIAYYFDDGLLSYTYGPNTVISSKNRKIEYHTYGDGEFFCPAARNTAEGTIDVPALIYSNNYWKKWVLNSIGGADLITTVGGSTTVTVDETYSYQKPNDYTGYTSLYLFARYDYD
ncbi:MAG: hypothetical protein IJ158_14195 [Treponema sp.]|nr:hypothetical protein [Treponema sp.]